MQIGPTMYFVSFIVPSSPNNCFSSQYVIQKNRIKRFGSNIAKMPQPMQQLLAINAENIFIILY